MCYNRGIICLCSNITTATPVTHWLCIFNRNCRGLALYLFVYWPNFHPSFSDLKFARFWCVIWVSIVGWGSNWGVHCLKFTSTVTLSARQACRVVTHAYNLLRHEQMLLLAWEKKSLLPGVSHWNQPCDFTTFSLFRLPCFSAWLVLELSKHEEIITERFTSGLQHSEDQDFEYFILKWIITASLMLFLSFFWYSLFIIHKLTKWEKFATSN